MARRGRGGEMGTRVGYVEEVRGPGTGTATPEEKRRVKPKLSEAGGKRGRCLKKESVSQCSVVLS